MAGIRRREGKASSSGYKCTSEYLFFYEGMDRNLNLDGCMMIHLSIRLLSEDLIAKFSKLFHLEK